MRILGSTRDGDADPVSARARKVEIVSGLSGLVSLREDWRALSARNQEAPFYTLYEWCWAYLQHLEEEPDRLLFAALRENGDCYGILPLLPERRSTMLGPKVPLLRVPMRANMDLSDLPLDSSISIADWWPQLTRALVETGNRSIALLIPAATADGIAVNQAAKLATRVILRRQGHSCYFDCSGNYESLSRAYTTRLAKILKRSRRALLCIGELAIQTYADGRERQDAFNEFLRLEASGWKGETGAGSAIALTERSRRFFESLYLGDIAVPGAEINLLTVDGRPIAGQLCIRRGGALSLLKIAFDQSMEKNSPGSVLLDMLLQRTCADPNTCAVSLVTGRPWMEIWGPKRRAVEDVWIFHQPILAATLRAMLWSVDRLRRSPAKAGL